MDLYQLGWNEFHKANFEASPGEGQDNGPRRPGRISEVHPASCRALTERGEETAFYQGRLRKSAPGEAIQPAVGDWAALETEENGGTVISRIFPRKSRISRNSAGAETREQVMAANVDTAFIVGSLNSELNPNRVERFLVAAYDGGVSPVVLLNKTDLCPEPGAMQSGMEARLPGVPVHAISAATGEGMGELGRYLGGGRTAVFLGSSGVGKSTIINRLLGGDTIRTAEVSGYKDRGRHTTTSREMYLLQNGGIVIDTPGLRELQIWDGGEGISQAFRDIEELSGQCRFSDCRHMGEPGCAVQTAVEGGSISQERLRSYHKILREASFHRRRQNVRLRIEEAKRWKTISKSMRHFDKSRRFSS
jgi:ribosome biogenesis GTPase